MRKTITCIIVIILLFSCKEKEPTAPTENPPTETLAESTIGPSGGELETDDFSLIIPEGSFNSTETLTLSESNNENPFDENTASRQFQLDGLPDNFTKPLKIKIKHNGSLSDESFILVGEEGMSASDGKSEIIYDFISAKDSTGYIVCDLPLNSDNTTTLKTISMDNTSNGKKRVLITAVTGFYSGTWNYSHYAYRIYLSKSSVNFKPEILDYFDDAYEFMLESGFSLPDKLPSIYVANLSPTTHCKFAWKNALGNKKAKGLFAINQNKMEDLSTMKVMIGREVLRLLQFYNDPYYPIMVGPSQQNHHWLNQATVTWIEENFVEESLRENYIPPNFKGNEIAPLNGMHSGIYVGSSDALTNAANHGYGMSSFIKFLIEHYGMKQLSDIHGFIKLGEHPIDAIILGVLPIGEYNFIPIWLQFLFDYLTSGIYNVTSDKFLANIDKNDDTFIIDDENDTLKTFSRSYNAFSTNLFQIDLKNEEIKTDAKLKLKTKPENVTGHITVFGLRDEEFEDLGEGYDLTIGNLEQYDNLIVAVTKVGDRKPYTEKSNIDLEIRLKQEKIQFKHCDIRISVIAIADTLKGGWQPGWYTDGSFTGNIYTGTINSERQGGNATGTIKVEVDDNFNIKTLNVMAYHSDQYGSSQWGFTAANIPPYENEPYLVVYNSSGSIVCSYVTSIYAKYTNPDETYEVYTKFECEEESLLYIKFHNID